MLCYVMSYYIVLYYMIVQAVAGVPSQVCHGAMVPWCHRCVSSKMITIISNNKQQLFMYLLLITINCYRTTRILLLLLLELVYYQYQCQGAPSQVCGRRCAMCHGVADALDKPGQSGPNNNHNNNNSNNDDNNNNNNSNNDNNNNNIIIMIIMISIASTHGKRLYSGRSSERHAEGARPPRRQKVISVIFGLLSQSRS